MLGSHKLPNQQRYQRAGTERERRKKEEMKKRREEERKKERCQKTVQIK